MAAVAHLRARATAFMCREFLFCVFFRFHFVICVAVWFHFMRVSHLIRFIATEHVQKSQDRVSVEMMKPRRKLEWHKELSFAKCLNNKNQISNSSNEIQSNSEREKNIFNFVSHSLLVSRINRFFFYFFFFVRIYHKSRDSGKFRTNRWDFFPSEKRSGV